MEPTRSSYVEYGQGNMLNLDAGTIKRKIDSNEYDDEIIQEVQPNGKRTCSPMNHSPFSNFGTPTQTTPKCSGPAWSQPNPSPLLRTAAHHAAALNHNNGSNAHTHAHAQTTGHGLMHGYQTPESGLSSNTASPYTGGPSMDMEMESSDSANAQDTTPSMAQHTNAMFRASLASPILSQEYHQQQLQQQQLQQHQQAAAVQAAAAQNGAGLLPSALPVPGQGANSDNNGGNINNEYVPVHGRSMQIPSYARVPLNEANEARRYRDQRWSSCIYGVDTRIGQGMMI